jgi:hypothetical protein
MSLVELKAVRTGRDGVILELGSLDLVDGTPIVDIKPYLPFAESQPQARAGFAQLAPDADMPVRFSALAEQQLTTQQHIHPNLRRFITQVLAQDPRPAYRKGEDDTKVYAARLLEFNVKWQVIDGQTEVISLDAG